jgi:murein tripeptide amidase MpaA
MVAYLDRLAASSDEADCQTLGYSVRGTPLRALVIRRADAPASPRRLRVMLVGSHHGGSEPAGGEALLHIGRALLHGDLRELPTLAEFVIVPDVNPDGRDDDASRNANRVNLNRDLACQKLA